jgi:hypothetical protein
MVLNRRHINTRILHNANFCDLGNGVSHFSSTFRCIWVHSMETCVPGKSNDSTNEVTAIKKRKRKVVSNKTTANS